MQTLISTFTHALEPLQYLLLQMSTTSISSSNPPLHELQKVKKPNEDTCNTVNNLVLSIPSAT